MVVSPVIEAATSLPAALAAAAQAYPEHGISLLDRRGRLTARHTYADLFAAAGEAAGRLAAEGVSPGDRVLVALPSTLDWFSTWFGAVRLGALPVAMTSLAADEGALPRRRLQSVIDRLDPKLIVGNQALVDIVLPKVRALTPTALAATIPVAWSAPEPDPSDTAFLQLTSGSTGVPRAVEISHRAVIHNVFALDDAVAAPFGCPQREAIDCWASWTPLNHDMGLNSTLSLMFNGIDLWLSPPQAFLGRPRGWLELLGTHGNSVSTAPNFGYQLCVERLAQTDLKGLDLSKWRVAFSAAEMIRSDTIDAFVDTFSPCGFRREAFRPGYGLAEATLVVSADRAGNGPRTLPMPAGSTSGLGLSEVVSTGPPVMDTEIRIVLPDGSTATECEVGEVLVKGPGIFSGYYNDVEATMAALRDGWLFTGDLGFMEAGELFLVGRLKDVLIVRGQNIMPHELEWLAESVTSGGGSSRAAAFSIARGPQGEEVVIVLEVADQEQSALKQIADDVRSRIGREAALPLADVVLVRRGRLPRTTSGKVRRDELRSRYLDQSLERLGG